jgi:Ca-activated chloride channel family protein
MMMRFADPYWLLVGAAAVTLLCLLLVRAERLRGRALALLSGAHLRPALAAPPSRFKRWLRVGLVTFAVTMGFVALARPQKGMHWETVKREGTDILLVLDTSHSMDADDVKPTRLERSKLAIRDLVERFPGDRIGLVAFAGDAFVQSPMTLDHAALLETVDALDTSIVARGGTNLGRAIDVASDALASEPDHQKGMVVLSDGENLEGDGVEAAKRAAEAGIIVDTVGVGSPDGELVPEKDAKGRAIGVLRDEDGKPVRSRLDDAGLRKISDAAHGTYRPLGADGRGLDRLYQESLAGRAKVEASSRTHRVYAELFEIPLGLAVSAILLEALLALPWRRRSRMRRAAAPAAAAAAGLLFLLAPGSAHASVTGAQKDYAAGRYEEAAKQYAEESAKNPSDARLAFNAGTAAYKAGHFDVADEAFKRALTGADPSFQEHVLYNQGDALYRLGEARKGEAKESKNTAAAKEAWKSAIGAYEGALQLDPKDADARFNRDLVKRKLAELEEQEKKDEQQKKNDDKKDQKDQQQQQGQGQQPKDQQGQGQQPKDQQGQGEQPKDQQGQGQGEGQQPKDQQGQGQQPKDRQGQDQAGAQPKPGEDGKDKQPNATGKDGKEPNGGQLSPRDARALLGGLKGEERRGMRHGTDAGAPTDEAPRKDW